MDGCAMKIDLFVQQVSNPSSSLANLLVIEQSLTIEMVAEGGELHVHDSGEQHTSCPIFRDSTMTKT